MEERRRLFSRRMVLASSAAVAAVGCGGGSVVSDAGATGTDSGVRPADAGNVIPGADAGRAVHADVAPLNALLAAEYGAIKAYDAGAGILTTPPANDPAGAMAPALLPVAVRFQSQHRDHATELTRAITALGGTPITADSVTFTAPAGFVPGVVNVLKLAANAEKAAAIAYDNTVRSLTDPANRFIAGAIEGDETQHFVILYSLVQGLAAPGPNYAAPPVVPTSFVSSTATGSGLETVPAFTYTA